VAGDFNDIPAGVGTGCGEEGDDDFVDDVGRGVEQIAQGALPRGELSFEGDK
jgi:hypothetical protein